MRPKNDRGQSTVEYMLLLLVVVGLTLAIGRRVRDYMIGTGECPGESMICKIMENLQGPGFLNGTYRYFTLKR